MGKEFLSFFLNNSGSPSAHPCPFDIENFIKNKKTKQHKTCVSWSKTMFFLTTCYWQYFCVFYDLFGICVGIFGGEGDSETNTKILSVYSI